MKYQPLSDVKKSEEKKKRKEGKGKPNCQLNFFSLINELKNLFVFNGELIYKVFCYVNNCPK